MTPSARLSAAMEILTDIFDRRRPAADALKDWGLTHRFAGSSDRAALASLVYDTLRRKASASWLMKDETPRGLVLGMLKLQRNMSVEAINQLCAPDLRFAPAPLNEHERERLTSAQIRKAPAHVQGDFPNWLSTSLSRTFGDELLKEMQYLTIRAPMDVRVNTLKATRDDVEKAVAHLRPVQTPYSPLGLRFEVAEDGRGPALQSEEAFQLGSYEIQDEGSQLTVALAQVAGALSGKRIIDLCAGAGGKTLAIAASVGNTHEIIATDVDTRRLAPIHQRIQRAGITNVVVRAPESRQHDALENVKGTADTVFIDAPCTGSGTWRRNPDAKWRLRQNSLHDRIKDQATVLERGAALLKKSGYLIYVTCSVLAEENDDAVSAFLALNKAYKIVSLEYAAQKLGLDYARLATPAGGLQLSPLRTNTDGFYMALLRKG